jgi:serine/threonine protein kinase/WD40 repeat protein
MSEQWNSKSGTRLREVFIGALEQMDTAARATYLEQACENDRQLRHEVERLLAEEPALEDFMATPVVGDIGLLPSGLGVARAGGGLQAGVAEGPGDVIGRFRLIEKLGEGVCAIVYRAAQEEPLRREVALKIIRLGMDTQQVIARFAVERQALAIMDHPNIARVFDAGATSTGRPFFVMELVAGDRLTLYCNRQRLGIRERLKLFIQVCQGIEHAHQKGIIHRDIKPSNILVASHDGVAQPKVIDFGIAKAIHRGQLRDQTQFAGLGLLMGTPAYMSPEQVLKEGSDIDTRSDIYSLGVLLYELLTGVTPFDGQALLKQGIDECRRAIVELEPVRPSALVSTFGKSQRDRAAHDRRVSVNDLVLQLRGDLDWIVLRALEKDRARRYPSASALGQDIENHLADEPVWARPPSQIYRLQKLVRRHRVTMTVAACIVVLLVLATGVSSWLAVRARRAEALARLSEQMEAKLRQQADRERERATQQAALARLNEYVADINLAQHSLSAGNYGRAVQLLNKHLPRPGFPDLRGFEWHYLWQLTRGDEHWAFPKQSSAIRVLALSPTGEWLATGTEEEVKIWSLENRVLVRRLPVHATSAAFVRGGRELLLMTSNELRRLNLETGSDDVWLERVGATMAVSGEGNRLAVMDRDGVQIWDLTSWSAEAHLPNASAPFVFSSDGKSLATATREGIAIWDLPSASVRTLLRNSAGLFRPPSWDQLGQAMVFSKDGRYLVAPRNGPSVRGLFVLSIWDAQSGQEVGTLPQEPERPEHTGRIAWMALCTDGRTLATASMDHSIRLWDLEERRLIGPLHGHMSEVWTVGFAFDGKHLVSGAKDGSIHLWSLPRRARQTTLSGAYSLLGFSADGRTLAVLDRESHRLVLKDAATFASQETLPIAAAGFGGWVPVALSANLQVIAQRTGAGTIQVYDRATRATNQIRTVDPGFDLVLSPDGRQLVAGGFGRGLRWWDLAGSTNPPLRLGQGRVCFSPDGSTLLKITGAEGAELWDTAERRRRMVLKADFEMGSASAFSPDGSLVAIASNPLRSEQTIGVWETGTGRLLGQCSGHKQGIMALTISPDQRSMASVSHDNTLRLWNLASRQELLNLPVAGAGIGKVLFSPDGNSLLVEQGPDREGIRVYSTVPAREVQPTAETGTIP